VSKLLTFSGLDGAGKTTQISSLVEYLCTRGLAVRQLTMYDDVSVARRVRQFIGRHKSPKTAASPARSRVESTQESQSQMMEFRYDKNRDDFFTVLLRQFVYLIDLGSFLQVRRRVSDGSDNFIIMDRYFYDSLANLLTASSTSRHYIRMFLRIAPQPDLPILLDIDPQVAFNRKREYPLEYLERRRWAYRSIFSWVSNPLVVDGGQSPDQVGELLLSRVQALTEKESTT